MEIDQRVIRLGIIIDNQITWYEDLFIEAKGEKFDTPTMAQCSITLLGLSREKREYILRETRPTTTTGKRVSLVLEVGRESYGTATLYQGDVFRSEPTPKPDIGVLLQCIVGQFNKNKLVTRSGTDKTRLSQLAKWCADDAGYGLSFEISDRFIQSYSFSGSAQAQIMQLEKLSKASVFVENKTLVVKDSLAPAKGLRVVKLNNDTGLLQASGTESGAKIKMLFHPSVNIGTQIELTSETNPSLNGMYVIFKLSFEVSNKKQPFYLVCEARQL